MPGSWASSLCIYALFSQRLLLVVAWCCDCRLRNFWLHLSTRRPFRWHLFLVLRDVRGCSEPFCGARGSRLDVPWQGKRPRRAAFLWRVPCCFCGLCCGMLVSRVVADPGRFKFVRGPPLAFTLALSLCSCTQGHMTAAKNTLPWLSGLRAAARLHFHGLAGADAMR